MPDTLADQTALETKKEYPRPCLIQVISGGNQTRNWRSEDIAI